MIIRDLEYYTNASQITQITGSSFAGLLTQDDGVVQGKFTFASLIYDNVVDEEAGVVGWSRETIAIASSDEELFQSFIEAL
jgi:hypothetical protein